MNREYTKGVPFLWIESIRKGYLSCQKWQLYKRVVNFPFLYLTWLPTFSPNLRHTLSSFSDFLGRKARRINKFTSHSYVIFVCTLAGSFDNFQAVDILYQRAKTISAAGLYTAMFEKSSDLAYLVLNFSSYSLKGSFLCLECKQRNMNEKLLTWNTTCSGKGFSEKVIFTVNPSPCMHI